MKDFIVIAYVVCLFLMTVYRPRLLYFEPPGRVQLPCISLILFYVPLFNIITSTASFLDLQGDLKVWLLHLSQFLLYKQHNLSDYWVPKSNMNIRTGEAIRNACIVSP